MKKTLIILTSCMLSLLLSKEECCAQDIEGLEIGSKYTKEQVIKVLGSPENYEIYHGDMYENEEYFYYEVDSDSHENGLYVELMDGMLTVFVLRNSNHSAFTKYVPGGIRVGDPFSAIDGCFTFEKVKDRSGQEFYRTHITEFWREISIFVEAGKITQIQCFAGE